MRLKKIYATGILSLALVGTAVVTTAPAQATHQIGHAILGGIIGGVIGNAITNRNNGYDNNRHPNDYGVQVYQPPVRRRPVYQRVQPRCWWQNDSYIDSYGRRRNNRVQVCN